MPLSWLQMQRCAACDVVVVVLLSDPPRFLPPPAMQSVMYHYVRPVDPEFPNLKFLHVRDFERQLDILEASRRLLSKDEFLAVVRGEREPPKRSAVLTFDDGLADHVDHVLPILARRGMWGVFYVPTAPLDPACPVLLSVHQVHILLAKYPAGDVMRELEAILRPEDVVEELRASFQAHTYTAQHSSTDLEKELKRVLNYYVRRERRQAVTDALFDVFFPGRREELRRRWYLSPDQVCRLHAAGMVVAAHSHNHFPMSSLPVEEQEREIAHSAAILTQIVRQADPDYRLEGFCFPYGGKHSYTNETVELLHKHGFAFAHDVAPADLTQEWIAAAGPLPMLRLPRADCSALACGTAFAGKRIRRIAVFTSNHPRHLHLVNALASVAHEVHAVMECTSRAPRVCASAESQAYFDSLRAAERHIFGDQLPLAANVRVTPLAMGDASKVPAAMLAPTVRDADLCVVFGASYIKGTVCEALVQKGAINLHAGCSPYYRGTATNFWCAHDGRIDLTAVTVHLLSAGLDSGRILFHVLPRAARWEFHQLGMHTIRASHLALANAIRAGTLDTLVPVPQDKTRELRYSRGRDFDDGVLAGFLKLPLTPEAIELALRARDASLFVAPVEM